VMQVNICGSKPPNDAIKSGGRYGQGQRGTPTKGLVKLKLTSQIDDTTEADDCAGVGGPSPRLTDTTCNDSVGYDYTKGNTHNNKNSLLIN
jgi:hypothetical protein